MPDPLGPTETSYNAGLVYLVATAVGWGMNWTVIKFVLHDWPPLFARGTAGLFAAAGLAVVAILRKEKLGVPRHLYGRLSLAATINVFTWMGFTALSLLWLKVAQAALLAYSMPIWATLLAWPFLGERPGLRSIAALVLGVTGLSVLMGGPNLSIDAAPGIFFALSAAILFAFGTIAGRKPIPLSPIALTAWQVGLGCIPMVLIGIFYEKPNYGALTMSGFLGMSYMALGPMAACYLTWFAALRRLPTATAATGMLLVPIVGTVSASLMLGEPIGAKEVVAFAITLAGVGLALNNRPAKINALSEIG